MPLFKGKASKAKPQKAIEYITNPQKAIIISSQSLDDNRNYAVQFKETCDLYGKGSSSNERKYYHFKLSCNPADNPTPQQSHELAEKLAQQLFPDHECVIATHNDTDTLHSHIIVNAVSFETGKKLHMNNAAYRHSKDLANELGAKMGLSTMDWRAKTKEKRERSKSGEAITGENKYLSSAERNMAKDGNLDKDSWKEALRHAIDEAKAHIADRAEFQRYLYDTFGVTMTRNTGKTVTLVHPAVGENYAVRGNKLGADYSAVSIDQALQQNKETLERSVLNARLFTTAEHTAAEQTTSTTATTPTAWTDPSPTYATNLAITGIPPTTTTQRPHGTEVSGCAKSAHPARISPSQRNSQEGHGKRTTPRSLSDISAELRSLDTAVGKIAGRVYKEHSEPSERNIAPIQQTTADHEELHRCTGRTKLEPPLEPTEPVRELQQEPSKPSLPNQEPKRDVQQQPKRRSYNRGR